MAFWVFKDGRWRDTGGLFTTKDGRRRTVAELWQMTADGWRLAWRAITAMSCFGSGWWRYDKGWSYGDGWKYND